MKLEVKEREEHYQNLKKLFDLETKDSKYNYKYVEISEVIKIKELMMEKMIWRMKQKKQNKIFKTKSSKN